MSRLRLACTWLVGGPSRRRARPAPLLRLLTPVLVGLVALHVATQVARADDSDSGAAAQRAAAVDSAPVVIDGDTLLRVRGVTSRPAAERARRIARIIEDLAADPGFAPEELVIVDLADRTEFRVDERMLFALIDEDAEFEGVNRSLLAQVCVEDIRNAIVAYRADRDPSVLLERALVALAAAGVLTLLLALLLWLFKRVVAALERTVKKSADRTRIQHFQLLRPETAWAAVLGLARLLRIALVVIVLLAFVQFVLGLFPWTRGFSREVTGLVVAPLVRTGDALVAFIPSLFFLLTLALFTRYALKAIRLFFTNTHAGRVKLSGFEPEWSWPTYRIVRLLVVAFAVIVAFPYLPGSDSGAFRGVSLFLGVIFSLGSTSVISNIVAGYTMTYRRAFHVGERVRIGDVVGDVIEMRLLVTHLRTLKNEEVVVPNSLILNQQVVNYSSLAGEHGLILHTRVGIGYEVPWRQVEALLLLAARDTPGTLAEPAPFVLLDRLGDFAVEYELNVACEDARDTPRVRTELHRRVLDAFNEHDIAIMTPAYVADPSVPKTVPKEHWFEAPAESPAEPDRGGAGG